MFSAGSLTPLDLHTLAGCDISLIAGWNLISLPVRPLDTNIQAVLAGLPAGSLQSVWNYNGTSWQSYAPGAPSSLTTMENGRAYWLMMVSPATLTVLGVVPLPSGTSLYGGWNMVGFTYVSTPTVEAYFVSIYPKIVFPIYAFRNGAWAIINAGGVLRPGEGYWVNLSQAGVLTP